MKINPQYIITPIQLKKELPITSPIYQNVIHHRELIHDISKNNKILIIIDGLSIVDNNELEIYLEYLKPIYADVSKYIIILFHVHIEYISSIEYLKKIRSKLLIINSYGFGVSVRFHDLILPQYISDLISFSKIYIIDNNLYYSKLISGLFVPAGIVNYQNNIDSIIDIIHQSSNSYKCLGINQAGITSIIKTHGNIYTNIVLECSYNNLKRHDKLLLKIEDKLKQKYIKKNIILDCRDNSINKQNIILNDYTNKIKFGYEFVNGFMINIIKHNLEDNQIQLKLLMDAMQQRIIHNKYFTVVN